MAEPIYNINFDVTRATASVTQTLVQFAGHYGDDKFARVTFTLDSTVPEHKYRIEIVDGNGAYDVTELLDAQDNAVSYTIPAEWTAAGTATLQLVELEISDDGKATAVAHFKPARIYFEESNQSGVSGEMQMKWQELFTAAESTTAQAKQAAQRIVSAQHIIENGEKIAGGANETANQAMTKALEALDEANDAYERAYSVRGVYVGPGDMPDGFNLQIDPSGEVFTDESFLCTNLDKNHIYGSSDEEIQAGIETVYSRMKPSSILFVIIGVTASNTSLPPGENVAFIFKSTENYGFVRTSTYWSWRSTDFINKRENGVWSGWHASVTAGTEPPGDSTPGLMYVQLVQ